MLNGLRRWYKGMTQPYDESEFKIDSEAPKEKPLSNKQKIRLLLEFAKANNITPEEVVAVFAQSAKQRRQRRERRKRDLERSLKSARKVKY